MQKLHRDQGLRRLIELAGDGAPLEPAAPAHAPRASLAPVERSRLAAALGDLESAKALLDGLLQAH